MARLKSEDKRNAILAAATRVIAGRGLGAPTSSISSAAGVAEGTLFTYFKTKDELINALYRAIKLELADAMMSDFPRQRSVRHRMQHVWNRYVEWGLANPEPQRALKQIEVWGGLTPESLAAGAAPFLEIQMMAESAVKQRLFQDLPLEFVGGIVRSLAEMTMGFMQQHPGQAKKYRDSGFAVMWAGIARNG
jgi:AcrR family transcriptional regulator